MANKTNRTITVCLSFILCSFALHPAYSSSNPKTEFFKPVYLPSDTAFTKQTVGDFTTSSGTETKALFENDSEIPSMIFDVDIEGNGSEPEEIALNFLADNIDLLNLEDINKDLTVSEKTTSPGSTHVIFQQNLNGLPLFDAKIGIHINNNNRVELVNNSYQPLNGLEIENGRGEINDSEAIRIVEEDFVNFTPKGYPKSSLGYLKGREKFLKVWKINYPTIQPVGDWIYYIDALTGEVLRKTNNVKSLIGIGFIFTPNPFVNPDIIVVKLPDLTEPESPNKFTLNGTYFEIINSRFKAVEESSPVFDYKYIFDETTKDEAAGSDPRFEEVMVYFQMENFRNYYKGLGFQLFNKQGSKINADAHGTDEDNSYYIPSTKSIIFGDGGVNDASDGDIIIHELGHAVTDFIKPQLAQYVPETFAMEEGYSDYLAASFFNDPCIGEWDSTSYSKTGCLRRVDGKKHYPDAITNLAYSDSEIWSATLWDIRNAIIKKEGEKGKKLTDKIILKSIYFLPDIKVSFKEGAIAILTASKNMFEEKYTSLLKEVFYSRGILKKPVEDPLSQKVRIGTRCSKDQDF